MPRIGMQELLVIGLIALLIFGPRNLPKFGKSIGDTIRELKKAGKELHGADEDEK